MIPPIFVPELWRVPPCPIEVMKKVVRVMGASEISIVYEQTEASPGVIML